VKPVVCAYACSSVVLLHKNSGVTLKGYICTFNTQWFYRKWTRLRDGRMMLEYLDFLCPWGHCGKTDYLLLLLLLRYDMYDVIT